jgi:thiol peroxidase
MIRTAIIMRKIVTLCLLFVVITGIGCDQERKEAMKERKGVITFKGGPLTLLGPELKVGQMIPDAALTAPDLSEVKVSSFRGKTLIVSTVPSLDTPVCDLQTKRFNEESKKLSGQAVILTVSMDLPFAQKRWCGAAGAEHVKTASDYKGAEFAKASGLLIKELHLLARSVIIADKTGKIAYIQIVPEVSTEPDYQAVLSALKKMQ